MACRLFNNMKFRNTGAFMKKIFSVILCLLLILGLTACGADEIPESSSSEVALETSSAEVSSEEETESDASSEVSSKENESSSKKSSTDSKVTSGNKKSSSSAVKGTSSGKKYPVRQKQILIRRANKSYFKCVGRDVASENTLGIELNWSCSSVEFDVDCEGDLAVAFAKGNGSATLYVEIYLDGKLLEERTKIKASGDFTIATDLEPGVHRVKIVRQTDCAASTLNISKILACGYLVQKAPENKPLYIEAIGDASLIGWGVRLADDFYTDFYANSTEKQPIARNKENQDGTLVYTYVAAEKLNADSYVLANQGAGIAATYHRSSGVAIPRNGLLPTMYEYCYTSGSKKHTPTRLPDIIVLDAGSADLSKDCLAAVKDGDKLGIDQARANEIAVEFLKTLRKNNPKAKIIWCYGLTSSNTNLEKYVLEGAQKAGGTANGIYPLKLATSARSGYPSAKEYAAAADLLVNKIKQINK